MLTQTRHARSPSGTDILAALQQIAGVLGMHSCWLYQRRYHFTVGDGWTIALSPDSAGRLRVDTCRYTRTVSSLWVLGGDHGSLAGVVIALRDRLGVQTPGHGGADEPCDLRGFDS